MSKLFWAGYYGLRLDASDQFIQGYLDESRRLDGKLFAFSSGRRIPGKKCGGTYISAGYKCQKENAGAGSESAKELAARSRAAKGLKPKADTTKFKPVTGEELGDATKIGNSFQHMYRSAGSQLGRAEQASFKEFVNGNHDRLSQELKQYGLDDQSQVLNQSMNRIKEEYISRANTVYSAASGTVSEFIAGGSNFNRKQATRRGSAYDRAVESFSQWQDTTMRRLESDLGLTRAKEQERQRQQDKKKQKRQSEADQKKAYEKSLQIANDPDKAVYTMTSAEWKRIPSDYKMTSVENGYKVRMAMRGNGLGSVYISDMKNKTIAQAIAESEKKRKKLASMTDESA